MESCTLELSTDYLLNSTGPMTATDLSRLLEGALSPHLVVQVGRDAGAQLGLAL